MRFLSNFGCNIIFMCFDYFGHLRDSKSLFNGRIGHMTSWCKWPIVVVQAKGYHRQPKLRIIINDM